MKAPSGLGPISIFLIGFSKVSFGVNNGFLAQNFCLVGLLVESDLRFNRAPLPIGESAIPLLLNSVSLATFMSHEAVFYQSVMAMALIQTVVPSVVQDMNKFKF